MSAKDQIIPAVSFTTAQTGASAKSDELGMRPVPRQHLWHKIEVVI